MTRSYLLRSFRLLALLTLLAVCVPMARPAMAATFTVTNNNDRDAGSLRQAIIDANAAPGSQITFVNPFPGAINLATPLPPITANNTTIDGLQGGAPKVEVRGNAIIGNGLTVQSSNNTIRGLIINGFQGNSGTGIGILIDGSNRAANNNTIDTCYIGTNAAGTALGYPTQSQNNSIAGVRMTSGASNNTVRGSIIAGNEGIGVDISGFNFQATQNDNTVTNSRIGVSASGTGLGNNGSGIQITDNSNNNTVGPDNVISSNGFGVNTYGVYIVSGGGTAPLPKGNKVVGNRIGTDPAGNAALSNRDGGVFVGASDGTLIGGPDGNPAASGVNRGNIISGNNRNDSTSGIVIRNRNVTGEDTKNIVVQNNWVGLNASGNAALSNTFAGINIGDGANGVTVTNNVIGGSNYGVHIVEFSNLQASIQTRNNTVTGNLIGTNAAGTAVVSNVLAGVFLRGAVYGNTMSNNRIVSAGDVFAGIHTGLPRTTPQTGLGPYNNTITGNQIGILANGTVVGNGSGNGINLLKGSNNNVIGPNNTISGHKGTGLLGINIQDAGTTRNQILDNSISGNTTGVRIIDVSEMTVQRNRVQNNTTNGIEVAGSGAIRNRITQTTTSGNGGKGILLSSSGNTGIAPPNIASISATATNISGNVSTSASCGSGCTVEVFDAATREDAEGPFYLASFNITGNGPFNVATPRACQPNLTFTITDANGNTSEFSAAQQVSGCTGGQPSLGAQPQITPDSATQTGTPGTTVTFQHQLTNVGNSFGTFNLAVSGLPANWNATVTPATASRNPGDPAVQVTVTATVPPGTDGGSYVATLTVTTQGGTAQDTAQDTIQVPLTPGLTFTPETQTKSAGAGQTICYDYTLTNTANGQDTFAITIAAPANWTPTVQPGTSITLAKNASQVVTVCLAIPQGTAPAPNYTTTITAKSNTAPQPQVQVTAVTTVVPTVVPRFDAGTTQPGLANGTVTVSHQLTNIGNAAGTFAYNVTLPPGFTLITPPTQTPPGQVNQNGNANVSYTVQLPPRVLAGSYNLTLRATAQDAVAASATVVDVVTVAQIAALTLTPDRSSTERPFSTVLYTQTLRNDGNFTDTVTLAATTTQGWTARSVPATASVPPFSSLSVVISLTIPLGQRAGVENITNVTATSSLPGVSASARITTTIAAVAGTLLTPSQLTRGVESGKTVTYTFALTNSGSIDQSYNVGLSGVPAGWTAVLTPNGATSVLVPGAGVPVQLVVTTPAGLPDGTRANISITATSSELNRPSATAIAQVRVGPPYKVIIEPDRTSSERPGTIVRYTHVVTNAGFNDDTIVLDTFSDLGWQTSVSPISVLLPPDATTVVTVTVVVPSATPADVVHTTTVKASSTGDPNRSDTVSDRTRVLQVGDVDISPGRFAVLTPGQTLVFQHTLTNIGNGADVFTITSTQDLNWSVEITPTQTVRLSSTIKYQVEVRVRVPANVSSTAVNRIYVRARSRFDPQVFSELVDIIGPLQTQSTTPPQQQVTVYLPLTARQSTSGGRTK